MNSIIPTPSVEATCTNTRPLKIALLGYRSHPFVGGQGIYIKYLSRALKKLGHAVHVYSGPPYPELDTDIELIKVPSLDLYSSDDHVRALRWCHLRSFTDTFEWWTMLTGGFGEPYTFGRRIAKRLKNSDYDVIHDNQSLSFGLLKLQREGHTVISTIHHPIHRDRELALQDENDWGMKLLIRRWHSFLAMQEKVVQKLQHVTTVSEQSKHDIAHYFRRPHNKTTVIFNGVDSSVFRPTEHIEEQAYTLLTTSSSDQPLKGLRYLLEALALIKTEYPQAKLRIIGKLKENGANQKRIRTLGLQKHIECIADISTDELVHYYNQTAIFICPSLYEGFGLPLAEAMACGRAVISTDGGALPEVVGSAGIVVPSSNAAALANAIRKLFSDSALRQQLGKSARKHVEQHFCWQRVAERLTHFYRHCLKNKA